MVLNKLSKINSTKYEMIGKTLYFPEQKILVIGDLHLGYEEKLHNQGIMVPLNQMKKILEEFEELFNYFKKKKKKIEKIIFLGDIKHYFPYNKEEKFRVHKLLSFLREHLEEENIIFIRGNHDKIDLGKKFVDHYIERDLCFFHGDKDFVELWDKKIKMLVMAHIHPSIVLTEEKGVKKEKYKCFLKGKFKNKEIIIVPSFLPYVEGKVVSERDDNEKFSMFISKQKIMNFEVFVVNEDLYDKKGALKFGKLNKLK
jgi:hypothetical protein